MNYIFNLILILFSILLKTTIISKISFLNGFFDIILIVVIYISYKCPTLLSIISIATAIIFMESLSIAPFGIYLTTYVWAYIFIKLSQKIFKENFVIVMTFLLFIIFENLIFAFTLNMINFKYTVLSTMYVIILKQRNEKFNFNTVYIARISSFRAIN